MRPDGNFELNSGPVAVLSQSNESRSDSRMYLPEGVMWITTSRREIRTLDGKKRAKRPAAPMTRQLRLWVSLLPGKKSG
jgi:hypothetical protein